MFESGAQGISGIDVRRAAMDLLARREHAFEELHEKLTRRFQKQISQKRKFLREVCSEEGFRELRLVEDDASPAKALDLSDIIYEEIEKLRHEGLQSDARLTEAYILARSNRGHGPAKISHELRIKGVNDALIKKSMATSVVDWIALINSVSVKKFGLSELDMKAKAKRNRFLIQRGFSFEQIAHLDR